MVWFSNTTPACVQGWWDGVTIYTVGDVSGHAESATLLTYPNFADPVAAQTAAPDRALILIAAGTYNLPTNWTINNRILSFIGIGNTPTDVQINCTQSTGAGVFVFGGTKCCMEHISIDSSTTTAWQSYLSVNFQGLTTRFYGNRVNFTAVSTSSHALILPDLPSFDPDLTGETPGVYLKNCFLDRGYNTVAFANLQSLALDKCHTPSYSTFTVVNTLFLDDKDTNVSAAANYGIEYDTAVQGDLSHFCIDPLTPTFVTLGFAIHDDAPTLYVKPAGIWNPLLIEQRAWYDAADDATIITTGENVTQWQDKSDNQFHMLQITTSPTSPTPTRVVDGVQFVSSGTTVASTQIAANIQSLHRPSTEGILNFHPFSTFAVVDNATPFTSVNSATFLSSSVTGNEPITYNFSSHRNTASRRSGAFLAASLPTDSWDTFPRNLVYSTWTATELTAEFNANEAAAVVTASTHTNLGSVLNNFMGKDRPGTTIFPANSLTGTIREILVFDQILPPEVKYRVEGYLAWKWEFSSQLPIDHPYRNTPPALINVPAPTPGCTLLLQSDFEADTLDAIPTGWTPQWNQAFGANGSWRVVVGTSGSRVLRMITGTANAFRAVEINNSAGQANGSLLFRTRWTGSVEYTKSLAIARASGTEGTETGYYVSFQRDATPDPTADRLILNSYSNGVGTIIGGAIIDVPPDTWVWIRLECYGDTIRTRYWFYGTEEPSTWTISTTDATHASGWWGPGARNRNSTYLFDDIIFEECVG